MKAYVQKIPTKRKKKKLWRARVFWILSKSGIVKRAPGGGSVIPKD